jgi:hypothetical protein
MLPSKNSPETGGIQEKLAQLVVEGKIRWNGGKPKGLRGISVRGEPMSETILQDRRDLSSGS